MAQRKYARKARKVPRKRTVIRKALRSVRDARISAVVKKVLGRQVEVKSQQTEIGVKPLSGSSGVTVAQYATNNVFMVSPNSDYGNITIGTTSQERIGNQIRIKYCKVRVALTPAPYDTAAGAENPLPRPTMVRFYCVSPRDGYLSASEMATILDTSFYQDGSTTQGYSSSVQDLLRPVNSDILNVHWTRTYKLGHSTMYALPVQASAPYPAQVQYSNNDFKQNFLLTFDVTKQLAKTYKYNDTQATPTGKSVFLIAVWVYSDGVIPAATHKPIDMWFQHDIGFTDM